MQGRLGHPRHMASVLRSLLSHRCHTPDIKEIILPLSLPFAGSTHIALNGTVIVITRSNKPQSEKNQWRRQGGIHQCGRIELCS